MAVDPQHRYSNEDIYGDCKFKNTFWSPWFIQSAGRVNQYILCLDDTMTIVNPLTAGAAYIRIFIFY